MDLTEKTLSVRDIYDGRILHIHEDEVSLPNGATAKREVVNHPGGVAILALDEEKNVLLVEQYRYVFSQALLEIPAGKLERGEDPYGAALRELREETGAIAPSLKKLGEYYPTPGFCDEIIRLYLAENLSWGEIDPDEDEFINVKRIPFAALLDQVLSGEIHDAKTCLAILLAKVQLGL